MPVTKMKLSKPRAGHKSSNRRRLINRFFVALSIAAMLFFVDDLCVASPPAAPAQEPAAPAPVPDTARYDGYRVVRAHVTTQEQLNAVEATGASPWGCVTGPNHADYLVSPAALAQPSPKNRM